MKTWVRLLTDGRCGACGQTVPAGSQMLRLELPAVRRPRWRCADCAGMTPPAETAEALPRGMAQPALQMTAVSTLAKTISGVTTDDPPETW